MAESKLTRRAFMQEGAAVAAGLAAGLGLLGEHVPTPEDVVAMRKTRSYNPEMEYRRLGRTGLWVSAACLGGHWKRIDKIIKVQGGNSGFTALRSEDMNAFDQNRYDIVSRCIERGINLIDACSGAEVMAYAKALKGRREKMYLNYSWYEKEMRFPEWRKAEKLLQGLDEGLRDAGLEYVDLWRITCLERGGQHTPAEAEEFVKALEIAKKQGKCRCTGLSSHDRLWLKWLIETYPQQIEVIVTPYTAGSKVLPKDSLFDAVKRHNVGVLGIKPFASNSLFKGDSSPNSEFAEEDDRKARLAIRYILCNPAISAPIPGLVSAHQVDNVVAAVQERRKLDRAERAELQQAAEEMWARLPDDYQWLKEWQNV